MFFFSKNNDILFSIAGTLGRVTLVTNDILPANTNQALSLIRIRKDSSLLVAYTYLILQSSFIQEQLESLKIGIAQPNLSLAQINSFKMPLPPLEIQTQIVQACEAIDTEVKNSIKKIEKARHEIEN